jgi:hypothetical protein
MPIPHVKDILTGKAKLTSPNLACHRSVISFKVSDGSNTHIVTIYPTLREHIFAVAKEWPEVLNLTEECTATTIMSRWRGRGFDEADLYELQADYRAALGRGPWPKDEELSRKPG